MEAPRALPWLPGEREESPYPRAREADALETDAETAAHLQALETAGERVAIASDAYEAEIRHRDRVVFDAYRAGISLGVAARVAGIAGGARNAHRAKERHRSRVVGRARGKRTRVKSARVETASAGEEK